MRSFSNPVTNGYTPALQLGSEKFCRENHMKVPPFLKAIYETDHMLAAFTNSALSKIENHVEANRMVFFPEYTDHSIAHVELTLQTAFDLATGPARGLITPYDAAAITVAVGLHDFGMHLTRDGFESLIAPDSPWRGVPYFDKKPWNILWDEFLSEATRFDDRKLRALFGESYRPVRSLPSHQAPWEDFDYLLVGEFIRRHHPRLAHEIAVHGLPAKSGRAIAICESDSEEKRFIADIAGLIARSHGVDLRQCLDYLQMHYRNRINPRRVHVIYLGVLLRIADYFQIQATRAPTERTDVTSFQSQLSAREWSVHQSIKDIHNTSGDPEAIVVDAAPPDVVTFLKLQQWLRGLQEELDRSWAILGEVYGLQTHNSINLLGLKIRRVKSNIDNLPAFAKTVEYVPARIAFEAANADLLKLLVAPLYSNDPGVAIRELIQNAVDAVREFNDSASRHPELNGVERYEQDADVVLTVATDENGLPSEITITDRGIGMSADTVREYFLRAGASFRRSNAWRQEHEDESGSSRVLRTGRFGVGALATFLLGDQIEVTTRYAFTSADEGIEFAARLDDETLSLNRVAAKVGTRIRIIVPSRLKKHVSKILPYRGTRTLYFNHPAAHYFLKQPSVKRQFLNKEDAKIVSWLPQPEEGASQNWRCFSNDAFEKVHWSFRGYWPYLSSNGIVIEAYDGNEKLWENIKRPAISVFDKEGRLPVNLQRTGLQGALPFEGDLLKSIGEDVLAHALEEGPNKYDGEWLFGAYEGFITRGDRYSHESYNASAEEWGAWLAGKEGFVLNEPFLLKTFSPSAIIVVVGGDLSDSAWAETLRRQLPADVLIARYIPGIFGSGSVRAKGVFRSILEGNIAPFRTGSKNFVAYIPEPVTAIIKKLRPGREVTRLLSIIERLPSKRGWYAAGSAGSPPKQFADLIASVSCKDSDPIAVFILEPEGWDLDDACQPLGQRWVEVCGSALIPYGQAERRRLAERAGSSMLELMKFRRMAAVDDRRQREKVNEESD
jgi:hypothetical protein